MHRAVAAAAPPGGGGTAAPSGAAARRRAADCAVIGSSLQAYAAAYLLAKRGKRTVLVEHAAPALAAPGSAPQRDVVLHLPAATAHLVNAASESLALWRGIEAAADARGLLQLCGSIDIAPARGSSGASDALGAMQDASQAAGLQFGMLSPDEVSAAFPRLRPPAGSAALYTPAGGVAQGRVALDALRAMALRAGADVAQRGKERCLLGWRDAGGHFMLRAASAAAAAATAAAAAAPSDEEVVWEVEQLVLLPNAAVQQQSLAAFGLAVPGAALRHVPAGRWAAQEDCAAVPVWQLLGTGSTRGVDDPSALDSCWGTPVLGWSPGGLLVAQSLADGQPAAGGGGGEAAAAAAAGDGHGAGGGAAEAALQQAAAGGDMVEAAAAAALAAGPSEQEERPGSEEAIDAQLARLAEQQRQREAAEQRLAAAGGLAARLVRGVGGRLAGPGGQPASLQLAVGVTPDGEPAVGSHPGFEAGRVVVGFAGAAAALGCLPGDQLAPLLGRLAAGEALGEAPQAVTASLVDLARESLSAEALPLAGETWAELGACLHGAAASPAL